MAGPGRGLGPRGFLTEEEKKNLPKISGALIRRILGYLKPYWLQFLLVFVTILLSAVVGLLPSIITGRIVDEALVGKNMRLLVQLLVMAFVTLTASQVISVLESYINAWISQRIIFDMKNQMYDHLQHMPHAFFTSEKQGDIITRMNTDISGVSSVISGTLSSIVSNVATVVTTLVALFTMSWKLALVGIVVIPLLILPTKSVGKNMRLLVQLLVMAFVTLTASQVISVLESYINSWISQRIIFDMKNQMYDHLQHMPHAFFTSEKQGDIITRMNTDISGVSSVISGTLSSIVSNVATVVTTLVALFTMSWQLAIVGIVVIPLLILPTRSVGKKRYELLTRSQAKQDEMNQLINETLSVSGSLLVKLFTREKREQQRFEAINDEVTKLSMKEQRSGKWFMVLMGMFTEIGPLLIYFAGGWYGKIFTK